MMTAFVRASSATILALLVNFAVSSAASANEFRLVTDESEFRQLIVDRDLTRFGIRLQVTPGGEIAGRGFGYTVTGEWEWNGNFFCREMAYGSNPIAHNCQAVAVRGDTVRFVSDQGQGDYADFRLR